MLVNLWTAAILAANGASLPFGKGVADQPVDADARSRWSSLVRRTLAFQHELEELPELL